MARNSGSSVSPLWLGLMASGLAGAAIVADRVQKVSRVPKSLRSPMAYLPITFNAASLPILRSVIARTPTGSPTGVSSRTQTIACEGAPDVGVLLHERPDRPARSAALLWIHGGGYVVGTAALSTPTCRRFAHDLNLLVASVDYRLAPEHPFPAPLDDCFAALQWLHSNADALGIDPHRIAIGGDSAGGGLAATLAQRALDAGLDVAFQLLIYPMLDDRTCGVEPPSGVGELVWTPASNVFGWSSYLGTEPGVPSVPPYAVAARRYELSGLPPAWIGVGTPDLFHTEDVAYAERLRHAGVDVTLEVIDGLYHGADGLALDAPESKRFYDSQVRALRKALHLAG